MDKLRINISNKDELERFFKILAKESVDKALSEKEEDPIFGEKDDEDVDDEMSSDSLDKDLSALNAEPENKSQDQEIDKLDAEPQASSHKEKVNKIELRPTPLTLELGKITSDGLIATLNMIRAGRSFKEADIAGELRKYFDEHLNDDERLAAATILSAIRDISSGKAAQDAPDPGDENVKISATDKEKEQNAKVEPVQQQQSQTQVKMAPTKQSVKSMEDTTPPIQVGSRDNELSEEYRKYIKQILNS